MMRSFDEILEIFKGQASEEYLFHTLTFKELSLLKECRLERLDREKEEMEKERKKMEDNSIKRTKR